MATVPLTTPTPSSQFGAEADKILKPKITVRIWVVILVGVVANAIGVFLHF